MPAKTTRPRQATAVTAWRPSHRRVGSMPNANASISTTRRWLGRKAVTAVACLGLLVFAGIGFGSVALGGGFLEYGVYPLKKSAKYGIEAVEIGGIALIVGGVIIGLFFLTAAGPGGEEA